MAFIAGKVGSKVGSVVFLGGNIGSGDSQYDEAFNTPAMKTPTEQEENPQSYDFDIHTYQHVKPARHMLGIVGGNEVSGIKGNRVDLESDLMGITRPATRGNSRLHQPLFVDQKTIERKSLKGHMKVNIAPEHQPDYQMWAYPATFAPQPFYKETCDRPEKF
jgi:hypothetical protein